MNKFRDLILVQGTPKMFSEVYAIPSLDDGISTFKKYEKCRLQNIADCSCLATLWQLFRKAEYLLLVTVSRNHILLETPCKLMVGLLA